MDNVARLLGQSTEFKLNGRMVTVSAAAGARLSHSLREQLGAKDVKIGCNAGDCGACTVLVDGDPVCACLMPTQQAAGKTLETLVGLVGQDPRAKALVQSFQNHQAAQCGICTPGVMVSAVALLRNVRTPTIGQIQDALGGVLCRCTGYRKIIDAVCEVGQAEAFPEAVSGSGAVGTSVARLDGLQKLQGREVFGDDVAPTQALVIKAVRSPFARAEFRFGDLEHYVTSTAGVHEKEE